MWLRRRGLPLSDLHKAFPPIPVRDSAREICIAVAALGVVLCCVTVSLRMTAL
jgi:hypothetical protein